MNENPYKSPEAEAESARAAFRYASRRAAVKRGAKIGAITGIIVAVVGWVVLIGLITAFYGGPSALSSRRSLIDMAVALLIAVTYMTTFGAILGSVVVGASARSRELRNPKVPPVLLDASPSIHTCPSLGDL